MHFHFFWNLWKIQNEGEVGEKLTSMFGGEKEEKKEKEAGLNLKWVLICKGFKVALILRGLRVKSW